MKGKVVEVEIETEGGEKVNFAGGGLFDWPPSFVRGRRKESLSIQSWEKDELEEGEEERRGLSKGRWRREGGGGRTDAPQIDRILHGKSENETQMEKNWRAGSGRVVLTSRRAQIH